MELTTTQLNFPNIKLIQFASPDLLGSEINMCPVLLSHLNWIAGQIPGGIRITSGYRTINHNKSVGGIANSSHLVGVAADVQTLTSAMRMKVVKLAIQRCITRIGIGKTYVHLDIDREKEDEIIFLS